eukprot:TRINITY_DN8550_c0_g1_i1.p1 TRINITY_DN8550_c0_g1~~TRINITY_DN8550_c0_g1_i1.p1  ORF type:complete len:167 (+),score=31.85 TRINITY_DN8550_c0_g1_i1:14-514(+)
MVKNTHLYVSFAIFFIVYLFLQHSVINKSNVNRSPPIIDHHHDDTSEEDVRTSLSTTTTTIQYPAVRIVYGFQAGDLIATERLLIQLRKLEPPLRFNVSVVVIQKYFSTVEMEQLLEKYAVEAIFCDLSRAGIHSTYMKTRCLLHHGLTQVEMSKGSEVMRSLQGT